MKWPSSINCVFSTLVLLMVMAFMPSRLFGQNLSLDASRFILKSQGYTKWETYVLDGVSFKSPVRLIYNEQRAKTLTKSSPESAVFRVYEGEQTFGETSIQFIHATYPKTAIPDLNAHLKESAERYYRSVGDTEMKYSIVKMELRPFRASRLSYLMKHTNPPMFSESIHLVKGRDYWIFHFLRPTDISTLAENFIKDIYYIGINE